MVFGLAIAPSIVILILLFLLAGMKVVKEYERGVRFTLGKYKGMMKPGLRLVIPVIQSWERVDLRVKAVDVPDQDCITKDNVSVKVNAVLYFKVSEAEKAIIQVENYFYATSQLSQTTMRDVVGEVTLDELLKERDRVSHRIQQIVDKATDPWGVKVDSVELKHIELPDDMKRTMAKEAEAEREKRAVIITAEGEVLAAKNMSKAAEMLSKVPGALHLRTLQSINDISSDQSNTIVFAVPLDILKAFEGFGNMNQKK
ncbi:MAG: slipin family protein [Nanoarchaeota archaeon]|nr:slipin family protein [Nanoarchaeota archaeon]MBU1622994.1 slipin family protein [Nanoarchaeota archaeon]